MSRERTYTEYRVWVCDQDGLSHDSWSNRPFYTQPTENLEEARREADRWNALPGTRAELSWREVTAGPWENLPQPEPEQLEREAKQREESRRHAREIADPLHKLDFPPEQIRQAMRERVPGLTQGELDSLLRSLHS